VKKQSKQSLTYLKFLNLVHAVRQLPAFPPMDPMEERLLNQLAASWHAGIQVTVLEAMRMSQDASATTVHRRLKTLRKKGIISLDIDEADNRIKYIAPTELATAYFAKLGHCLDLATKG
jgi:hypothetical protein